MLALFGSSVRRNTLSIVSLLAIGVATWSSASRKVSGADEAAAKETSAAKDAGQAAERKLLREQSGARIAGVKVTCLDAPNLAGELVKNPLTSYTDEPLFIDAATVWAWTLKKEGRPLALCKVEHYDVARLPRAGEWLYCFTSLSTRLVHAEWPDGHEFTARQPGVSFRDIPAADRPGETPAARQRQMKDLSRHFTASFDIDQNRKEELRLLTQPLYRYSDPEAKIVDGTVFTAAVNGTNPTAMFLIELQEEGDQQFWRFAVAAMTDGAVVVKYDGKEVWSKPALHAPGKSFDTWMYFFENKKSP
jgi:hypothetical protein